MINISRRSFLALPAVAAAATLARPAFAMSDAQNLVEKSRLAFLDMITDDNYKEMRDYVKQARALIIFPELIKGAFIIGAEGGSGVLVTRGAAGAGWSYPAFYTLASGSLGLQIGGQSSELVLTIISEKALNAVINDQFKVGGNVDVAVGPVEAPTLPVAPAKLRGEFTAVVPSRLSDRLPDGSGPYAQMSELSPQLSDPPVLEKNPLGTT